MVGADFLNPMASVANITRFRGRFLPRSTRSGGHFVGSTAPLGCLLTGSVVLKPKNESDMLVYRYKL